MDGEATICFGSIWAAAGSWRGNLPDESRSRIRERSSGSLISSGLLGPLLLLKHRRIFGAAQVFSAPAWLPSPRDGLGPMTAREHQAAGRSPPTLNPRPTAAVPKTPGAPTAHMRAN
jgi:hypothetical protein